MRVAEFQMYNLRKPILQLKIVLVSPGLRGVKLVSLRSLPEECVGAPF
jgi:hypothetical protein